MLAAVLLRLRRVVRRVITLVVRLPVLVVRRLLRLSAVRVRVVLAALVGIRVVLLVVAARRVLLGGLVLVTAVGVVLGALGGRNAG